MFAAALIATLTNLVGIVTFTRADLPFFFLADSEGAHWRVEIAANGSRPRLGEYVAVAGERELSVKRRIAAPTVVKCAAPSPIAPAAASSAPDTLATERGTFAAPPSAPAFAAPPPLKMAIPEIFAAVLPYGDTPLYGAMVETEGLLRDINRRQNTTQLLVGDGDFNLQVEIPQPLEDALPENLVQGATVRVTGALVFTSIENFEEGIFARIENVELLPLVADAVEVIRRVPFWTVRRLVVFLGGLLVLFLAVTAWAVLLRRMVARRTRELSESIRQRETTRIEADAARRERLRLAADLHDGFQQYLAGAMFRLKAATNYLPEGEVNCRGQLEKVRDALQHTQNGLRSTLWAMNEESEGPESLMALFGFAARRMAHWEGIVEIVCEGEERKVARKSAGSLLLIMQEAVGNAIRHGKAAHVRVRLSFDERNLSMAIIDDGCGFLVPGGGDSGSTATGISTGVAATDKSQARTHYGLASMERRANELGGTMTIRSKPRLGSKLLFQIPLA